jgi:large subunit ribosomal protein L29
MKVTELREMSDEQLNLQLRDACENLFRLRIQAQTERLDAPSELRRHRRMVAQDQDHSTTARNKRARKLSTHAKTSCRRYRHQ